ncbi:hypothetical protein [Priestia aryabhattai]|uniref:hypothetical protein n=1 Tax=Priestia aryabhattai TaxID=412384 RepID=UPI0015F5EC8A|nr:hypothetical protein [Priestia aryabhattai]
MEIKYIFEHKKDKDIQEEVFTIEQVENGVSLEYVEAIRLDGYKLIKRSVEE